MSALRFLRTVLHTRPNQLVWRLRRVVERAVTDRSPLAARLARARLDRRTLPSPTATPPKPCFEPRSEGLSGDVFERCGHRQAFDDAAAIEWSPAARCDASWLAELSLHAMEYAGALPDPSFERVALDWIEGNPPYARGAWRSAWNSWGLSIRCVTWMGELARPQRSLDAGARARIADSIARQLRYLHAHLELDLGGNHLIKDLVALFVGSAFFAGREPERWRRRAEALLARELDEQILGDGMHYERSPAYHAQVFCDLLTIEAVLEPGDLREQLVRRLRGMARVLRATTHPDGAPSLFNDGGLSMAPAPATLLEHYQERFGPLGEGSGAFALPDAGYYGLRAQGELLLFDCGPIAPDHLPAHGHGDVLSFEWSVAGRRLIVDPGVLEYAPGTWRGWSRSTRAHNTLTVADQDQCEFWSSFRVGRRVQARVDDLDLEPGSTRFTLRGSHDGFAHLTGHPRHERSVVAGPGTLEVQDRVAGGVGQPVRARLLLHPDVRVERSGRAAVLELDDVRVTLETSAEWSVEEAHFAPDFGVLHRTKQLVLDYGAAPTQGGFQLARQAAPEPARSTRKQAVSAT